MPKNRFGGKNAKKMANKKTGDTDGMTNVKSLPLPEEDGQYFAKVTKRCGDGRFIVDYIDERNVVHEGMARVPGSLRKLTRNVRDGSIVIFQAWGLSENDNKGSILHLYSDQEVIILTKSDALSGLVTENQNQLMDDDTESHQQTTAVVEDSNHDLDFDDI